MAMEGQTFEQWLRGAKVASERLSDQQRVILHAAFQFLQQSHGDYSSARIAGHFLLRCGVGLEAAQIARLVGISTRSAFRHRKLSATQVAQQIQHHFRGRPYGKLLPRHAGSIAEFLFTHPKATRDERLDFIGRTWGFRVRGPKKDRWHPLYTSSDAEAGEVPAEVETLGPLELERRDFDLLNAVDLPVLHPLPPRGPTYQI